MEQARRRLRRLALGVLHDTYLPSVEELLGVYFQVNRWNPKGLQALLQEDVKTYAKRWALKEIHELLEQKPPEVQVDIIQLTQYGKVLLGPIIKENETTDKDAIRRAVDKAVLSAAQHDTSICPLVIYDYERYTPRNSFEGAKSKKVDPGEFNNNMRLALYAMSTTTKKTLNQYSDDMERFKYAVASLQNGFVLLCKEWSTNRGQTTVYMNIQTEHALTYAGAVECLLHTTKTLLDRWLMLAKILKPQKLPRYSNRMVWFHNQIQPPDERSDLNSWVVSTRGYIDKQVQTLEKDIKELQRNKQKKWDLLWEGSFRDWIEKNLSPDSSVLSMWDKLMARAKENKKTPENWDDMEKVRLKEEIEYNEFWETYHKANPPTRWGPIGTVDILDMLDTTIPDNTPKKTWTRGGVYYSDIAEYYDIFFNEKQQYSCSRSSELEAKILLDLMTDTYLDAETKNREQEISSLLTKEEARKKTEAMLDAKIREEISTKKSRIQELKASQEKGEKLITKHKNQLEDTNTDEGQKVKLRSTVERNEALFVKNNKKLQKLEKALKELLLKLERNANATLLADPLFVPALRRFGITNHSPKNTIKMQLEGKQKELKDEVSGEIRNLVVEWRSYVTAMKDKQVEWDKANKEIRTLKTKLEHPELALGYWQRPAWGGCLFFVLVKHQPHQWQGGEAVYQEEEVVLQWFEVKTNNGKIILKHRCDKVTSDSWAYNYRLERVPSSDDAYETVIWPKQT